MVCFLLPALQVSFQFDFIFKRHFTIKKKRIYIQFHKLQCILEEFLQKTYFIILQILIYTISVYWIWFHIKRVFQESSFIIPKKIDLY